MEAKDYKKEYYEKGQKSGVELTASLNTMSYEKEVINGFVDAVTSQHRTIQQSSMRAIYALIMKWAEMEENNQYDLRNEATVKFCKKLKDTFNEENGIYLPFV